MTRAGGARADLFCTFLWGVGLRPLISHPSFLLGLGLAPSLSSGLRLTMSSELGTVMGLNHNNNNQKLDEGWK